MCIKFQYQFLKCMYKPYGPDYTVTFCTVHHIHTKQGLDTICSHTAEPS